MEAGREAAIRALDLGLTPEGDPRMADSPNLEADIERRLKEAGSEFIESHRRAEQAIREAVSVGVPPDAISLVSGLSPETVRAFLR